MEATFLNGDLESSFTLDVFKSFLWIDRFAEYGDFEITVSPTENILSGLLISKYINVKESDHAMVIEDISIESDPEEGNTLIIKGRSLESILTTRIVWNPTVLTGNFQDAISLILTENAINPTDTDRKITKLEFVASTDPVITALTIDNQAYGETLYDVLHAVCLAKNIGFKITITTTNKFRLELYAGKDRSYDQTTNSYVVFSPSFDNLMNSNYQMSNRFTKTVALVAGEMGVGNIRTSGVAANPAGTTDLDRKEIFVDAQSIGRNSYGETPLTDEEYLAKLVEKGNEVLGENVPIELFDGQAIIDSMYVFGVDYFMGDIIQISNEYGNESKSRIIEMKYFQDPAGVKMTPTYSAIV